MGVSTCMTYCAKVFLFAILLCAPAGTWLINNNSYINFGISFAALYLCLCCFPMMHPDKLGKIFYIIFFAPQGIMFSSIFIDWSNIEILPASYLTGAYSLLYGLKKTILHLISLGEYARAGSIANVSFIALAIIGLCLFPALLWGARSTIVISKKSPMGALFPLGAIFIMMFLIGFIMPFYPALNCTHRCRGILVSNFPILNGIFFSQSMCIAILSIAIKLFRTYRQGNTCA